MMQFDPTRLSAHVLDTLRPFYFSDDVDAGDPRRGDAPSGRASRRARCSTCRCGCIGSCPSADGAPVLVLGAEGDRICDAGRRRGHRRHHGVEATILPRTRTHDDAGAQMGIAGARARAVGGGALSVPGGSGGRRQRPAHEFEELVGRQRLAHPEPLEAVAAARLEEIELRPGADPLGNDLEPEPARKADDRLGDRGVAARPSRDRR